MTYIFSVVTEIYSPHANLNASIPEQLQCWPDICLQLVLHTSQTQKLHFPLQALYNCCNLQDSVVDTQLGLVVAVLHTEENVKGDKMTLKGWQQNRQVR